VVDKTIIEASIKGDLISFKKLINISSPYAYTVAFRMLGNESQASDVVQESMITIWKSIKKLNSTESYRSWMYRIVINKCYDQLRKRKRNPEITTDEKSWSLISDKLSENPYGELENREIAEVITLLTEKLSPKQKAVFILSELEDMTAEEILHVTGMSKMNIKANLHYARTRIRELIEKHI
jgi:RNA polymerase sigma-70 factor, ECF subfamily